MPIEKVTPSKEASWTFSIEMEFFFSKKKKKKIHSSFSLDLESSLLKKIDIQKL